MPDKACALFKGYRKKHSVALTLILLNPKSYVTLTVQYQKKKQKSNLDEDDFQHKALVTQSWLNNSVQDQHTQKKIKHNWIYHP